MVSLWDIDSNKLRGKFFQPTSSFELCSFGIPIDDRFALSFWLLQCCKQGEMKIWCVQLGNARQEMIRASMKDSGGSAPIVTPTYGHPWP
jgi:hypothetical protein